MREADTLRLYDYLWRSLRPPKSQLPTPNSNSQRPTPKCVRRHIPCIDMENLDWRPTQKPYDLRERLFEFACLIVRVVQFLHTRGSIAVALSDQLLRCGTSAGANYEEADDGSSDRDSIAKQRITLRELKEARFRLRVLLRCGLLNAAQEPVVGECDELVRIMATVIKNAEASRRAREQSRRK
jgi:four helix bundle protein